jgi:hypothetical protein
MRMRNRKRKEAQTQNLFRKKCKNKNLFRKKSFADPDPFSSGSYSNENLTKYASCLAPCGSFDKENQVNMYIKYRYHFRYITF